MGIGGISIWQLLIIFGIIIALFGTKRFRNIGSDLGSAIKGFKQSVVSEEPITVSAGSSANDSVPFAKAETTAETANK